MTWDVTLDFEYVVTKQKPPRVCFGTGLPREVLPTAGPALSPFMRRTAPDVRKLGPADYDNNRDAFYDLRTRKISKRGLGDRAPRWRETHEYQPPPRPLPPPPRAPQNCAPFNSTSKRKPFFRDSSNPPPCNYNGEYKKKSVKFAHSFGGHKELKCAVQINCVPWNLDTCEYCGCSCSAQGDYWKFENKMSLCRRHYAILFHHCSAKFQGVKLALFKSVRDCFFMHSHNSCKAALKIMAHEDIVKKLRKEAYLDLYFPQRRLCADL